MNALWCSIHEFCQATEMAWSLMTPHVSRCRGLIWLFFPSCFSYPPTRTNIHIYYRIENHHLLESMILSRLKIPVASVPGGYLLITWNLKHLFINGWFNWMIPNHYIENCCFTKHPFKTGCLGYQVLVSHYTSIRDSVEWGVRYCNMAPERCPLLVFFSRS